MTNDDLIQFFDQIMPYFTTVADVNSAEYLDVGPVGFSINTDEFDHILDIIQDGLYSDNSENEVRGILAVTSQLSTTLHGRFRINEVFIYLHCDAEPRLFI